MCVFLKVRLGIDMWMLIVIYSILYNGITFNNMYLFYEYTSVSCLLRKFWKVRWESTLGTVRRPSFLRP